MERKEEGTNNGHEIPYDITYQEILPRLPVQTIYRFRSVCKRWYALPHDAKFAQMHYERSLNSPKIIILSYKTVEGLSILSFSSLDIAGGSETKLLLTLPLYLDAYAMERPCHGLVCFSAIHREEIYLCNPSTNEFLQLPRIDLYDPVEYFPGRIAGFGLDELTKEYKVLFALQSRVSKSSRCFLFTLGSVNGRWRQIADVPDRIRAIQSAYLNGTVYWLTENPSRPDGILSFSFQDEKYRTLPVPKEWKSFEDLIARQSDAYLKVIGGYLRLFTALNGSHSGWWQLKCWTLKDPMKHVWDFEFMKNFYTTSDFQRLHSPIPVDIINGNLLVSGGRKLQMLAVGSDGYPEEIISGIRDEDDLNVPKIYRSGYVESMFSIGPPRYRSYERIEVDQNEEMQAMVDELVGK